MRSIRESIKRNMFPQFVKEFISKVYSHRPVSKWVTEALKAVNINLEVV